MSRYPLALRRVVPAPETEALYDQIVQGALAPPPALRAGSPPPARRQVSANLRPFVGREAECAQLNRELATAAQGRARMVVIGGELG